MRFLVTCAVQAPSSHNTQPWLFDISQNIISVYADLSRNLKIGDPQNRELYESVGTSIANIELAAKALGLRVDTELLPDKKSSELVAKITINFPKNNKTKYNEKLLKALWDRRSNRTHYISGKLISDTHLTKIQDIAKEGGLKLHLISDQKKISRIGEMVRQGMVEFLSKPTFRDELSHWVRHNWSKKGDGLPGYSIGMPGIISILAPVLVKSTAPIQSIANEEKKAVESCPVVGVISVKQNNKLHWVKTGIVFEKIAIYLHEHDISSSILTAAVECKSQNVKLTKMINANPTLFFRVGYASGKGIAVPRRDDASIMFHSKE